MSKFFYETSIGKIGIEQKENHICRVYFATDQNHEDCNIEETPLLKEASMQLNSYLEGKLKEFTLPLYTNSEGTEFMQAVWDALCKIPYGGTMTYGELAQKIGRPKAQRAVGRACNRNPIPIFIPCHRIIGANNKLIGYGGGLAIKQKLLSLETNHIY